MIIPFEKRFYDTNKWHGVISWGMPMQVCNKIVAKAFDATGRMFEDERFEYNWRRTADVGYERGSYLFWWTRSPKLMAERYVRTLGKDLGNLFYRNVKGDIQPLLVVDFEPLTAARQMAVASPAVTARLREDFHVTLQEITKLTGIFPVIYTGPNEWKYYFPVPATGLADWQDWSDDYLWWWSNPPYLAKAYPTAALSAAHNTDPDWEVYWDTSYLAKSSIVTYAPGITQNMIWAWQYTYKGRVPGVNADCDLNWILRE